MVSWNGKRPWTLAKPLQPTHTNILAESTSIYPLLLLRISSSHRTAQLSRLWSLMATRYIPAISFPRSNDTPKMAFRSYSLPRSLRITANFVKVTTVILHQWWRGTMPSLQSTPRTSRLVHLSRRLLRHSPNSVSNRVYNSNQTTRTTPCGRPTAMQTPITSTFITREQHQ